LLVVCESRLPNGLTLNVEPLPGARSVAVGVLIDAGPADDPEDRLGLCHLSEHMLFGGTTRRTSGEIARLIDGTGGQIGAFTTRDYTCLHACVLEESLPYVLDLFGDILLHSTLPVDTLRTEQQAILRELAIERDTPLSYVHQRLKETIWPDHPLGRAVHGRADGVLACEREDVRAFLDRHHRAGAIQVAACGAVVPERFAAQAEDAFWALPSGGVDRLRAGCQPRGAAVVETGDVSQAYFCLGLPTGPFNDPDRYPLFVLNALWGGSLGSRLMRRLRDELGLVHDISSEIHAYRDAGLLVIQGSTAPERLTATLSLVAQEFLQLVDGTRPVDDEELWTARRQLRGHHELAGEQTSSVLARMLTQKFYLGRILPGAEIPAALEQVEAADVTRVAERLLTTGWTNPGLAVVVPPGEDGIAREAAEFVEMLSGRGSS
jgi:predicted Zn-dependent peptidase